MVENDEGNVVDRTLMDYVLISKRMVGRRLDVKVWRGEGGGMSSHFLVEARLKLVAATDIRILESLYIVEPEPFQLVKF